ncbi:hypothetical protein GCM10011584_34350 [Nocardioides phosphati]|uniref:Uncharacterized protein n=1 Tax=Nocardioides phosphati TaxID=1867775 RepID=A0ABQ2NFH4_9ACTN|nr:hypothetical protein [Nocardioides phosphati]GGO94097.1 hypothetical protein GCM10011584_34350 [Nocardioides phosphati]
MSTTPRILDRSDRPARRRAALTVAIAFATAPATWWLAGTVAIIYGAALLLFMTLTQAALAALAVALTVICGYALATAGVTYFTPRSRTTQLAYLETDRGRAATILRPDPRRGALPGDVQAAGAGAWPKHRGVGPQLGEWIRENVHEAGGRVTLTATPSRAQLYRAKGCVDDGRTAGFLIRLATKPRPTPTEMEGERERL